MGGTEPLRLGRGRTWAPAAGHPALPFERQLLDHGRRRGPRSGVVGAARAVRVRGLLPRADRVRAAQQRPRARRAGDAAGGRRAVVVRGGREAPRLRDLAQRPGIPARPALSAGDLAAHDIALVRADNPGPLTLSGTNTWVVGRWVVDPGPALGAHLDAVAAEVAARGGAEGIAVTHDHEDHVEGLGALLARLGDVPVVSARGGAA